MVKKADLTNRFVLAISLILPGLIGYAQDVTFPRQLTNQGSILTLYQPQVEKWTGHELLDFRAAFSVKPAGAKEALGVLYMKAKTEVNMENHRVLISNMSITAIHFPSLQADSAKKLSAVVNGFLTPDRSLVMSLEQIVSYMEHDSTAKTTLVNTQPPVIFFSKKPTILLQTEGPPQLAEASKESLEFVFNANYPLFFDKTGSTYYLFDGTGWKKGKEVNGSWSFTASLPASIVNLAKDSNWVHLSTMIPAPKGPTAKTPDVFYADQPAELILFEGEPTYKAISGTALKYATNTDSDIFLSTTDKKYYFLAAGRWFSAGNLNGPWAYATDKLPADFRKIPANNPAAAVLPFVPGTDQAKDAVLIAQIPVTATVNTAEAAKRVKITYAGEPQFKPIDSTSLFYAVNTTEKVIKVSNTEYYACVNGVWFVSGNPNGPWKTATSIPASIYQMPPSSPVYNVTYVTQVVTSPTTVQASYTSGYTGVFIVGMAAGMIIVSGTGYYHPPYYYYPPYGYPVCYHYPMTYGVYAYKPYPYGGVAYRASYNPYTGTYARSATAYGPYGSVTAAQAYNPYTGTYARGASVATPYGRSSAAQAYNPYTGAAAATRQGSSPYGQWGTSAVTNGSGQWAQTAHATTSQGSIAAAQGSGGGKVVAGSGQNNNAAVAKTGSGDVYAGANGNVYKKTESGWQTYENGSWNSTSKPTPQSQAQGQAQAQTQGQAQAQAQARQQTTNASTANAASAQRASSGSFDSQQMNREAQNRQRGNMQTQQFNARSGGGSFSGRSGGRRGGR